MASQYHTPVLPPGLKRRGVEHLEAVYACLNTMLAYTTILCCMHIVKGGGGGGGGGGCYAPLSPLGETLIHKHPRLM